MITILDVAIARGAKEEAGGYSAGEFERLGLPFLGGCCRCEATIACYNACPSQTGYLMCKQCIEGHGFETVQSFEDWCKEQDKEDV
jgi:hypothetical protein